MIRTIVLRIENIHLDPIDLVAEDLGLAVSEVAQHDLVRVKTLAHVLPDTRRGYPSKQQAPNKNSEFHSLYVFRLKKERKGSAGVSGSLSAKIST